MDELLQAIENLKRAYNANKCVTGLEITFRDGTDMVKVFCNNKASQSIEQGVVNVMNSNATVIPHKQTNGEWLRGLSDEEFRRAVCLRLSGFSYCFYCHRKCGLDLDWLRAEHKENEE